MTNAKGLGLRQTLKSEVSPEQSEVVTNNLISAELDTFEILWRKESLFFWKKGMLGKHITVL